MQTFANWIALAENEAARLAVERVADCVCGRGPRRAINPLFLYGSAGSGKSHLVSALLAEVTQRSPDLQVALLAAGDFEALLLPEAPPTPTLPHKGGEGKEAPSPLVGEGWSGGRWLMMSDVCKHCVVAPCQQACPTGAILHNEFENVYIQPDICNGCAYCIAACPFGVITRTSFDGHAHKCTLCYDRQRDGLVPACAKACPTASIQFGPLDELHQSARRRVAELHGRGVTSAHLYGETPSETYSGLNSFYLLVDRPSVYGLPEKPFNPWLHMRGDYIRALAAGLAALATLALVFLFLGN